MKHRNILRVLTLLVAAVLCIGLLPVPASATATPAADTSAYDGFAVYWLIYAKDGELLQFAHAFAIRDPETGAEYLVTASAMDAQSLEEQADTVLLLSCGDTSGNVRNKSGVWDVSVLETSGPVTYLEAEELDGFDNIGIRQNTFTDVFQLVYLLAEDDELAYKAETFDLADYQEENGFYPIGEATENMFVLLGVPSVVTENGNAYITGFFTIEDGVAGIQTIGDVRFDPDYAYNREALKAEEETEEEKEDDSEEDPGEKPGKKDFQLDLDISPLILVLILVAVAALAVIIFLVLRSWKQSVPESHTIAEDDWQMPEVSAPVEQETVVSPVPVMELPDEFIPAAPGVAAAPAVGSESHSATVPEPVPQKTEPVQPQSGGPAVRRYSTGEVFRADSTGRLSFGRSPSNTVVFSGTDTRISGKHCVLYRENGNTYLMDVGSTNGTFSSSGKRLEVRTPWLVRRGMVFHLAEEAYTFVVIEE